MRACYLHLPRFPIQRRVRETPSLAGQPFALEEQVQGHRRVAFASGAAAKAKVAPGMTLAAACALHPALRHFPYRPEEEQASLASLGEALMALGPGFQLSAPDGLWLDASAAPLCGGEEGLCARALKICAQQGYRAFAAVAGELFTARALGRFPSAPARVVRAAESGAALAPLPLEALEGRSGVAYLQGLGLTTLGEVAALPPGALIVRLGASGLRLQRLCRGEDDALLVPALLPEQIEERAALDWPAESIEPLLFAMKSCMDRICARLSARRRAAVRLILAMELDPAGRVSLPLVLARPCAQSKLMVELARHRLMDLVVDKPVAGCCVRVDESCEDRAQQLSWDEGPSNDAALDVVLSRLATALGEEALFSAELMPSHRPERAYADQPFRILDGRGASLLSVLAAPKLQPGEASVEVAAVLKERPTRLFPRAAALEADLDGGGGLRAARLLGKRRRVTALAGPERLSGEWWEASGFDRDYYRVHFEGLGPVWIYRDERDGRFYLQGMFD